MLRHREVPVMASSRIPSGLAVLLLLGAAAAVCAQEVRWTLEDTGAYDSSPALGADGTVYVGTGDGKLLAVSPTGREKWVFGTGGPIHSSPAVGSDGTVFVGSEDGSLYAIRADGTQKWSRRTGGSVYSSPAIGLDGTIYFGSADGKLYAIRADGTGKWTFQAREAVYSSPAIGEDGTIYLVAGGKLYAVTAEGKTTWAYGTGLDATPAIGGDGTIYVGSGDGNLYAIGADGTRKWSFEAGASVYFSAAIGPDGTIYVGADDGMLYAISAEGQGRWTFDTEDSQLTAPAVGADGTIFVGSHFGKSFHALTPAGRDTWSLDISVDSSPAIGPDGTIYLASSSGTLYALRTGCGGLARSPWPMFRRDASHTGAAAGPVVQPAVATLRSPMGPSDLVLVEGGTFQMGSTAGESDERPVHAVTISSFLMSRHEVTQAEYASVMGVNPSHFVGDETRPVEMVSWYDAVSYCNVLSELEGLERCYAINGATVSCDFARSGYRLPTEAEWEFAARGGALGRGMTYSGSDSVDEVSWYGPNSGGTTHSVGTKLPNELGLHDMGGNVWEWCWDWYRQYQPGAQTDPAGPSSGTERTARGGSWFYRALYERPVHRGNVLPGDRYDGIGFRVVRRTGVVLVLVHGGTFSMGDVSGAGVDSERPVHTVTVSSFSLGRYEVTQKEWVAVMGTNPSEARGDDLPVERVSWLDAVEFCNRLAAKDGLEPCYAVSGTSVSCDFSRSGYRLPTEAEWEYAAKGGRSSRGYEFAGSSDIRAVAWFAGNSGDASHPVGRKLPNELGLFDMSGNVWEWCWDWYAAYSAGELIDPIGPANGTYRVLRGGSWWVDVSHAVRTSYRYGSALPERRDGDFGLRLARSAGRR
jgi:formylglycine-generating enzyme required for sulfatase activity